MNNRARRFVAARTATQVEGDVRTILLSAALRAVDLGDFMQESGTSRGIKAGERDQFIPIRKSDVISALTKSGLLIGPDQHEKFRQLCRLLGAIFHYEYFEWLERLRDDYYYFNPEVPLDPKRDPQSIEEARLELLETLEKVLKGANHVEVPLGEIEQAHEDRHVLKVKVETTMEHYHQVRFFRRGRHKERLDIRKWFGLRQNFIEAWVFDNVVLMVTIKLPSEFKSKRRLKELQKSQLRPGSILIKYFRHIASSDLHMLFPKVRVVMSLYDKLTIAVPALAGGIPLIANLLPTLTVLFLVAGFYLGLTSPVAHEQVVKAFAAFSGLAALGALIMRQRLKYERLSLKYQKQVSDHVYFRNVSNNAGIFDYIVGAAEEQESKEAFLAYYFLLVASRAPDQETLDARIEEWLSTTFGVDIDFEVDDALAKLQRLGLLKREGEKLAVLPLDEALIVLDRIWDQFFLFANQADSHPREAEGTV
jgi:hypothetical protein